MLESILLLTGKQTIPLVQILIQRAKPHSSVGSVAGFRTGGRRFDPPLDQYSLRGLMIVNATGFTPLSPLSIGSTMVMWESSQRLGKNIVLNTVFCEMETIRGKL